MRNFQETPPITYELMKLQEQTGGLCSVLDCERGQSYVLVTRFETIITILSGVCTPHAHKIDEWLQPVKIGTN